jgi:hypothetical protein
MTPQATLDELLLDARERQLLTPELATALPQASLWCPVTIGDDDQPRLIEVSLDGRPHVPAFSSEAGLREVLPESAAITQSFESLAALLPPETGLVLNPNMAASVALSYENVQSLLAVRTVPVGATLTIGEPAEEPTALFESIARSLAVLPEVLEARRCLTAVGGGTPTLVVGIGIADGDGDATRDRVAAAIMQGLERDGVDLSIDLTFLNDRNELTAWMMEHAAPFYAR